MTKNQVSKELLEYLAIKKGIPYFDDLSKYLGIHRQTLKNWIEGKHKPNNINFNKLIAIVKSKDNAFFNVDKKIEALLNDKI